MAKLIPLGFLRTRQVLDPNWTGFFGDSSTLINARAVAVDSSGDVYIAGDRNTDSFAILAKVSSTGSLLWQRSIGTGVTNSIASVQDCIVDGSGNIYIAGWQQNTTNNLYVAKYAANGTQTWQVSLQTGVFQLQVRSIGVDSSLNVYIYGDDNFNPGIGNTRYLYLAKLNSSGTVQWQRRIVPPTPFTEQQNRRGSTDSSGNSYVISGSSTQNVFAKYNTSGAIVWQRSVNAGVQPRFIRADTSGNSYIVYENNHVAKWDTNGVLLWQRVLTSASIQSLGIDSSGNIYIVGSNGFLAKYNTSGTIQWQRRLSTSDGGIGIAADTSNFYTNIYATNGATWRRFWASDLPQDGSKVGNYNIAGSAVTYGYASLTESAGTMTAGTPVYTAGTPGYILGSNLTAGTPTYTWTRDS